MTASYIIDETRAFITISGEDRFEFLQGLISNDVEKCLDGHVIWSALLTPQGKFLHDFFVIPRGDQLVIECDKDEMMSLGQLLRKYQLRSNIQMGIDSSSSSLILLGEWEAGDNSISSADRDGILFVDPRDPALGSRFVGEIKSFLSKHTEAEQKEKSTYDDMRIHLGIPDGTRDIEKNKGLLLEYGFEELNGVDWDKGCYMGQELTARTKYRALIKKRLMVVKPADHDDWDVNLKLGDSILANAKEIGQLRSVGQKEALAFIRLDRMEKAQEEGHVFLISDQEVVIHSPSWFKASD